MIFLATALQENWNNFPWHGVNFEVYKDMPTLVYAEVAHTLICFLCLLHAFSHFSREQQKRHILLWISAMTVGPFLYLLSISVSELNNCWYSQATFMITPRLPLVTILVYCEALYITVGITWFSGIDRLARPFIVGLISALFQSCHDQVGTKMLWWSWHDSDNNTNPRIMDVPVSATFGWCMYANCFCLLLHMPAIAIGYYYGQEPRDIFMINKHYYVLTYLLLCICIIPLSITVMAIIQCSLGFTFPPNIEPPSIWTLVVTILSHIVIAVFCGMYEKTSSLRKKTLTGNNPKLLVISICLYYIFNAFVVIFGKPEEHISLGLHQQYGHCDTLETDFSGFLTRKKYVCKEERMNPDSYEFIENEMPNIGDQWYKIKGIAKNDEWLLGITITLFTSSSFIGLLVLSAFHERNLLFEHEN